MQFLIAVLVFVVVTIAVFAAMSLFDQRKAQARVLRDRLSTVQKAGRTSRPDVALLRDEVTEPDPRLRHFSAPLRARLPSTKNAGAGQRGCPRRKLPHGLRGVGRRIRRRRGRCRRQPPVRMGRRHLGFFLPYAYASHMRTKRFAKFEEKFPEAIDTLARAVRAGHAFTTALEMIANEVAEPVAGEFRQLYEEQKFGLPVRDASSTSPTAFRWSTSSSS